jgi:hypothetical protein
MVFNATFNTSSGISCRSVLLVEEIVAADDYYIVSNTPRLSGISLIINVYYRTSSLMTSKRYILIVLATIIHSNIRT